MSVVIWENLISRRRSRRNPAGAGLPLVRYTYNTSSLVQPMILRLTAPNWERPSPDYGSHIIMSISGIYLPISIHTLYHSQVLSLIQVHEITYFHHTLCFLKYTSAPFSSLAPTDDFPPASPYTPYHGLWSADKLYPASSN